MRGASSTSVDDYMGRRDTRVSGRVAGMASRMCYRGGRRIWGVGGKRRIWRWRVWSRAVGCEREIHGRAKDGAGKENQTAE